MEVWGCFLMSRVRMLHFLKDWWKFIQIHQYYTMALMERNEFMPGQHGTKRLKEKNKIKDLFLAPVKPSYNISNFLSSIFYWGTGCRGILEIELTGMKAINNGFVALLREKLSHELLNKTQTYCIPQYLSTEMIYFDDWSYAVPCCSISTALCVCMLLSHRLSHTMKS